MDENIFRKMKAPDFAAVDPAVIVQAGVDAEQPTQVEDLLAPSAESPFEEGLISDRLSIGSIPDEDRSADGADGDSQDCHSYDTSSGEVEELIIATYLGDSAIPANVDHRRALLDSLIYWATAYVWCMCKKAERSLRTLLLVEINNLHNIFHLNTEATSEAMWLYRILRKSKVFVNSCKEAFSKDNPLQLKLGDNVFCAFATYVVSVYAVLEKKGLKLNEGCAIPLGIDESLFKLVTELIDIAHELRNAKINSLPGLGPCVYALTRILEWMDAMEDDQKTRIDWILSAWYMKAALEHRNHDEHLFDQFFVLGGQSLFRACSGEIALKEYKRLQADWMRFPSVVAESPMTSKWVTKILEKYIVGKNLDIEDELYWVHLNARMSLVTCCFTIWVFERLWDGTHLRKALADEYDMDDHEAEVVQIYYWAARGATLVMDDVDYQPVLKSLLPEGTTKALYEKLQRAMLQDLEYRLFQSWNKTSEWLGVQWARTSNLDECVRHGDLLAAFKTIVGLVDVPLGPQSAVQEEADEESKSDKEKVDIVDV